MLRPAEEILKSNGLTPQEVQSSVWCVIECSINDAQKEAIIECSERAEAEMKLSVCTSNDWYAKVNKESITKILNEIK